MNVPERPRLDRALILRRLILAEILSRRGEGPLALRPPLVPPPAPAQPPVEVDEP